MDGSFYGKLFDGAASAFKGLLIVASIGSLSIIAWVLYVIYKIFF